MSPSEVSSKTDIENLRSGCWSVRRDQFGGKTAESGEKSADLT